MKINLIRKIVLGLIILLKSGTLLLAQTSRTFLATEDNTLYDPNGSTVENANGKGEYLFTGVANINGMRRALLKFNFTSLPSNITITDVQLKLRVSRKFDNTPYSYELYRVNRFWTEGASNAPGAEGNGTTAQDFDCTWTRSVILPNAADSLWNNPGGDFESTRSAVVTIANEVKAVEDEYDVIFTDAQLIADVQAMLNKPADNYGWIVRQADDVNVAQVTPEPPRAAVRFRSANSSPVNFTPTLRLTYVEGSPLSTMLSPLNVTATQQEVQLKWTLDGIDADGYFLLEHATDQQLFVPLAQIPPNEMGQYHYAHTPSKAGQQYYRVQIVDATGIKSQLRQGHVYYNQSSLFDSRLYYTNLSDQVVLQTVSKYEHPTRVKLYDTNGNLISSQSWTIPQGSYQWNLKTHFSVQGWYILDLGIPNLSSYLIRL